MLLNNNDLLKNNIFFNIDKKKFIIHFVGIGGNGMSGIAEFLVLSGYKVTGSDIKLNDRVKNLISLGIKFYNYHSKKNVINTNLVVYSSAIDINNSEIISAKFYNIYLIRRIDMLNELIKWYYSIVVVGSHGKTTTTALIFDLLFYNDIKINCINGGNIKSINSYIYLSDSKYFLLELDESDRIFLKLRPTIVVLTNIDNDHLNNYNNDINKLILYFVKFLKCIPFYGFIIACIDNPIIKKILNNNLFQCKIITYGFNINSDFRILNFLQKKNKSFFSLFLKKNNFKYNLYLNFFGKHNVLNSVASICLLKNLKKNNNINLQKSLNNFKGVNRRSEFIGKYNFFYKNNIYKNIVLILDYGHHPTELKFNVNSIRNSWLNRRIVVVFQPHRLSRTKNLFVDFINVLSNIDILLLLDIYDVNEKNNFNIKVNSNNIISSIYDTYGYVNCIYLNNKNLIEYLFYIMCKNDVIVFQGAGNVDLFLYKLILKYSII